MTALSQGCRATGASVTHTSDRSWLHRACPLYHRCPLQHPPSLRRFKAVSAFQVGVWAEQGQKRARPCVPHPAKLLCVHDTLSPQPRRGLPPVTLLSPHAVPSTAASSLEWHVFPTVHHSVWQTLCRRHGCAGHGYLTGQPIGTNPACRKRITPCEEPPAPESPSEPHRLGRL